jgi:hypothetical protein
MSVIEGRPEVTGIEHIEQIANMFVGNPLFINGLAAGEASERWSGRPPRQTFEKDSPVALLASMTAWEGEARLKGRELDLAFSVGAVVGAFATRQGVDVWELQKRLSGHSE